MSTPEKSEVTSAIVKGALIEAVLLGFGVAYYLSSGVIWGVVAAGIIGSGVLVFMLAQAGAFTQRR